jgi:hypothetical protein
MRITPQLKTARIEHIVTDQGNGGAFCNECNNILGFDVLTLPDTCPNCGAILVEGGTYISTGGSDF